jgi:hypothetical protein
MPEKAANNWNNTKNNYIDKPLRPTACVMMFVSTDLNRTSGTSNGIDLREIIGVTTTLL